MITISRLTSTCNPAPRRIYLALPLTQFRLPFADEALHTVQRSFPDATVLDPRGLFADNVAWRQGWPAILATLDALVYAANVDGFYAPGVDQERRDALAAGLPVWFLTRRLRLHPDSATLHESGDCWRGDPQRRFRVVLRRSRQSRRTGTPDLAVG